MEKDVMRLDAMNSNYENRKHGSASNIYNLITDFGLDHKDILKENLHQIPFNLQSFAGQKMVDGSYEKFVSGINNIISMTNEKQITEQVKKAA